jgi:hypothetical protein
MLVRNLILVEQLGHFFGDHIAVVRDGDERDFLAGPGWTGRGVGLGRLFGFFVAHGFSIHHSMAVGLTYSNDSNVDFSGN